EATSPVTADRIAVLLEASWLSDETLYTNALAIRSAGNRSRCRLHAARLTVALALYRLEQGKAAKSLQELVPKYLSELPTDPYSGQPFRYRVSAGEHIEGLGRVLPGQGIVWSTGPDRTDHGGRQHGAAVPDDDPRWSE